MIKKMGSTPSWRCQFLIVQMGSTATLRWCKLCSLMKAQSHSSDRSLLKLVGSPLISFQELDPRCIANLFLDAVCIGENTIDNEACFVLKIEVGSNTLKEQCSPNTEIVHRTIWGCFSQRTGLLIRFEDAKLERMKSIKGNDNVFWETSVASTIDDYRYIDSLNIAHNGKTITTLHSYGATHNHKRKIEEHGRLKRLISTYEGCPWKHFCLQLKSEKNKMVVSCL